ncbi:MAG TPA: MBL fold metallo-hydrolase [Saprospiraceae bacterium]|nr:MBL fold metallo-hydrolase [Saprospiraceae bacterium]HMQ84312.1 MBL fold metallo-hydrolase [Saprospiraceae bacterium]
MKVSIVETGFLKLDGGAMFGIVPKPLWQKLNPPDENNKCTWALRCLLVEKGDRKILIDTGIGNKQDAIFQSRFEPHGDESLLDSIAKNGIAAESITDVLLTHLHFDHVGGAVQYDNKGELVPAFPNARYWTNDVHYRWACEPNAREKASFLPENFLPLEKAGVLSFLSPQKDDLEWLAGIKLRFVYGHTEAMMVPIIPYRSRQLIYCADVMPSSYHVGMPYVMSYDIRPLLTLEEKERILTDAAENGDWLIFEHDPKLACVGVVKDEKGRIAVGAEIAL